MLMFWLALGLALLAIATWGIVLVVHGPLWIGIVALVMLYIAISTPVRMIRHGGQQAAGYHPGWGAFHSLMWIGFVALLFWVSYTYLPGVREVVDSLMWAANLTVSTISETIV